MHYQSHPTLHKPFCQSHVNHKSICASPNLIPRFTKLFANHTRSTNPFAHHQTSPYAPQTLLPITREPQTPLRITKYHSTLHKLFCQSHTNHKPICVSPNPTPRSTKLFTNHTLSTNPFAHHQTASHAPQTLLPITTNPQITLQLIKLISRFTKFSYLRRYSIVLRRQAQSPADLC